MKTTALQKFTEEDREKFKKLNARVIKASEQFVEGALALEAIKREKLYKVKFKTYREYCESIQEISAQYANRLIRAGQTYRLLEPILAEKHIEPPRVEAQLQALGKVGAIEDAVEVYCELLEKEEDVKKITAAKIIELGESRAQGKGAAAGKTAEATETPAQRMQKALEIVAELKAQIENNTATTRLFTRLETLLTPGKRGRKGGNIRQRTQAN